MSTRSCSAFLGILICCLFPFLASAERSITLEGHTVAETDKAISMAYIAPPTSQEISFVIRAEKSENTVEWKTLEVLLHGKQTQHFSLSGYHYLDAMPHVLNMLDLNFDGQLDLLFSTSFSAGPNSPTDAFVYEPATKRFRLMDEPSVDFSGYGVESDPENKIISVHSRASCCRHVTVNYQWTGKKHYISSVVHDGTPYSYSLPFIKKDEDVEELENTCGQQINYYNPNEELLRTEMKLLPDMCGNPITDDKNPPSNLLALLKKRQKGYQIEMNGENEFIIHYDLPKKGFLKM